MRSACSKAKASGSSSDSVPEYLFSILTVLVGSVLLVIVFCKVAMLVSNFNANETNYQRKLENIVATMNKLHLPEPLRRRIHQYYTHLWREYESLDGDISGFLRELSHQLALEVRLCKYMKLVVHVAFWRNCSPDFVTQIVLSLVGRVYLPDDYVIRQGEIGSELFMINRGICELIVDKDGSKLDPRTRPSQRSETIAYNPAVSTGRSKCLVRRRGSYLLRHCNSRGGLELLPGEALGEMNLLMNYRHTANVLGLTLVEMCIFTREAFQLLIRRFADDRCVVLQRMIHA